MNKSTRRLYAAALAVLLTATQIFAADRPPGVVVNHSPASSRQYIGSPGLAVTPNGEYIASHDLFGPGSTNSKTLVFVSVDRGKTWARRAEIEGQWWSSLFFHRDGLYLMGTSRQNGNCVIRRSTDHGRNWSNPADARTGLLLEGKFHCAPVPVVVHNNRIWRAMEDLGGPDKWARNFRPFVMSAPFDADLLRADSWTCTNRVDQDPKWLGGQFGGWLEGNAVVALDNEVVNILRVDSERLPEQAAIIRVSPDGKIATFDPATGFVPMPGGAKKFTIRFDPLAKCYWTLSNSISAGQQTGKPAQTRNTLALLRSNDLREWEVRSVILSHPDREKHGYQYVDWLIDGDEMIALCRTAHDDDQGGANNYHDANWLTFHRISNFRKLNLQVR